MTNGTEGVLPNQSSGKEGLPWPKVEEFFREHGCVIEDEPELRWYRESWGAMEKAGLTREVKGKECGLDRTVPRLRAVCLLAMYLGIYQVAGESSELGGFFSDHPDCSWYFDSLNVGMEDIWTFVRWAGELETEAGSYSEEEDADDELLNELAADLVVHETQAIFAALMEHYGGKSGLFESLWRSRVLENEAGSVEEIADSIDFGDANS